jgi:hypothetical protein
VDGNTFIVATGAVNGVFLLGALGLWLRYRERRAARTMEQEQRVAAELQELRAAIDSIALEVERLGEGQRFVSRVLVERGGEIPRVGAPPRVGQERVITPH